MIEVDRLHKSFDGGEVLRGASFRVNRGEILALIGPSGDGKSVLLKHIVGLLRPDRGRVIIEGNDICRLRGVGLERLRNRFGFLFQNGALFESMTVYDNVAFPLRERTRLTEAEVRQRVLVELDLVGLTGSENKYPSQISGGMVKRAALARELVRSPEIMLFDEPTTGLDPIIKHAIHNLIESCHRRFNFTAVIVSHEIPSIFGLVQKVAMLHGGVIQIVGSPKEVLTSEDPVVREFILGSIPKVSADSLGISRSGRDGKVGGSQ